MRVDAKVQRAGKLDRLRRVVKALVSEKRVADSMGAIVDRFLRIKRALGLQKATLRVRLRVACDGQHQEKERGTRAVHQDSRLSASRVNASSFIGTLY